MRLLLAAFNAPKGDVAGNLERHVAAMERARAEGCELAVFPELSLTGSVDPARHPEHALPVGADPVRALVAATSRTGVAAVFGIAERDGASFHITQAYAHDGRLGGVYRKRHLGEGEEAYQVGRDGQVFEHGAVRFGVTLCAEAGVDFPWPDVASGGGLLVLFCAAPGLYGRRTDDAGWRDGHAWWVRSGLGDAVRHARRLGVWVAMATQAGSTEDEDFPGLAALVSPSGEVTRLPDWRAGTLAVEVPLDVAVPPVREAVRCLVVDAAGRTLLVRFADDEVGTTWWSPPGGGLDPGEDHLAAAHRELREELDQDGLRIGPWIGRRSHTFWWGRRWMTQRERWLLCRAEPFEVDPGHVASLSAEGIGEVRWWSAREIRSSGSSPPPAAWPACSKRSPAGASRTPARTSACRRPARRASGLASGGSIGAARSGRPGPAPDRGSVEDTMDRDDDGVPDWQQDERYADEAPVRGPWRTRVRRGGGMPGGCALPLVLLGGAGLLARLADARRRR